MLWEKHVCSRWYWKGEEKDEQYKNLRRMNSCLIKMNKKWVLNRKTEMTDQFSSVTQLCPTFCDPMDCNMPGFPVYHQLPNSCQSSRWYHASISSSVIPFSSHLQSLPASGSFQMSQFFTSGGQRLEFQLQYQSSQWIFRTELLEDGLIGSPCSRRHSHESFLTAQFKSINSLLFSFLYSPIFTSIHDYWKTHNFD